MRFPAPDERKKYPSECDLCRGDVSEETITLTYADRDGVVRIVYGVPAGVCQQCHEKWFTADTSRAIDQLLKSSPAREESAPVWDFSKAGSERWNEKA